MQVFVTRTHRFRIYSAFIHGVIDVTGSPAVVSPSSDPRPLARRLRLLGGLAVCGVVVSGVLVGWYSSRHTWYVRNGDQGVLFLFGAGASAAAVLLAGVLLMRARSWSAVRVGVPSGAVALMAIGFAIAWGHARPSLAAARAALDRGDIDAARLEANALIALGNDPEGGRRVLDDEHLQRIGKAATAAEARRLLDESWHFNDSREVAVSRLTTLAEAERTAAFSDSARDRLVGLESVLAGVDDRTKRTIEGQVATLDLRDCLSSAKCECAKKALERMIGAVEEPSLRASRDQADAAFVESAKEKRRRFAASTSPYDRKSLIQGAISDVRCHESIAGVNDMLAIAALEDDLKAAQKEVDAADKKAEAEARVAAAKQKLADAREEAKRKAEEAAEERKRKAEEAAEERRRKAEEAAEPGGACGGMVQCNDGSCSPSCSCSRSSFRGCCSHHGGIAGCN